MKQLIDLANARSEAEYKPGLLIHVNNRMQKGYSYLLGAEYGFSGFQGDFIPELSPDRMLELGVFEGKYLNDCSAEYPREWFERALLAERLSPGKADIQCNCFKIKSRRPLYEWRQKGWIYGDDPRGWFEWYCRYYIGRRDSEIDMIQIKRWRAFRRHLGQIEKNCVPLDVSCRPRQRQALLQWAYNPFV